MTEEPRLQKLYRDLSKWARMKKYYEAKEAGQEFSQIESSIFSSYGEEFIKQWGCEEYSVNQHKAVNRLHRYIQGFIDTAEVEETKPITSLDELI